VCSGAAFGVDGLTRNALVFVQGAAQLRVDESAYPSTETFSFLWLVVLVSDIHLLPPWIFGGLTPVLHELVEQGAVVHERLAQLFGTDAMSVRVSGGCVALPGGMRGPVMLNDLGMVGGDELSALTEVAHGVAAVLHHVNDQPVRLIQRTAGLVDEIGLHRLPASGVAIAGRGIELPDVESVSPTGHVAQVPLRITFAASGGYLAVVLGTEPLLQVRPAAPAGGYRQRHDDRKYDDPEDDPGNGVHVKPPRIIR
jgi:hypothetical protein